MMAMMREWVSVNGAKVRQRIVRQKTTIARIGTLPEAFYHEVLWATATKGCNGAIGCKQESMESDTDKTDEVLEYHTDANEQETIQNEIVNEANFLLGANLQFGRPIKFDWKFSLKVFKGR